MALPLLSSTERSTPRDNYFTSYVFDVSDQSASSKSLLISKLLYYYIRLLLYIYITILYIIIFTTHQSASNFLFKLILQRDHTFNSPSFFANNCPRDCRSSQFIGETGNGILQNTMKSFKYKSKETRVYSLDNFPNLSFETLSFKKKEKKTKRERDS